MLPCFFARLYHTKTANKGGIYMNRKKYQIRQEKTFLPFFGKVQTYPEEVRFEENKKEGKEEDILLLYIINTDGTKIK